jgi:hypothetical protein
MQNTLRRQCYESEENHERGRLRQRERWQVAGADPIPKQIALINSPLSGQSVAHTVLHMDISLAGIYIDGEAQHFTIDYSSGMPPG